MCLVGRTFAGAEAGGRGLSFLVNEEVDALEVLVRWGDYRRAEA